MNALRFEALGETRANVGRFDTTHFEPRLSNLRNRMRDYVAGFLSIRNNSAAAVLPRVEEIPHQPTRIRARYLDDGPMHESGISLAWIAAMNQRDRENVPMDILISILSGMSLIMSLMHQFSDGDRI